MFSIDGFFFKFVSDDFLEISSLYKNISSSSDSSSVTGYGIFSNFIDPKKKFIPDDYLFTEGLFFFGLLLLFLLFSNEFFSYYLGWLISSIIPIKSWKDNF